MSPGPGPGSKSLPGQSGGRRPSFSGLGESRFEERAVEEAAQQKSLSQQAGDSSQSQAGGSALKQAGDGSKQPQQRSPREVGSLKEELVERPLQDIKQELTSLFDINRFLEIDNEDTPEEKVKKKQMLQRWQQLTKAEQKVAQEAYQQELKKKQEEEEKERLKQQRQQEQEQQPLAPPSSPKKGPGMFGQDKSSQSRAQQRLQQQRQTIGTMGSPN